MTCRNWNKVCLVQRVGSRSLNVTANHHFLQAGQQIFDLCLMRRVGSGSSNSAASRHVVQVGQQIFNICLVRRVGGRSLNIAANATFFKSACRSLTFGCGPGRLAL